MKISHERSEIFMRQRRHPLYIAFMTLLVVLLIAGIALFIWGSIHHTALPRPTLMIPPQVYHG